MSCLRIASPLGILRPPPQGFSARKFREFWKELKMVECARARAQQFQPKRVHPDFQSLSTFYDASMSPNVDGRLTLSIPRNSLPLSTFHRGSLENFDTLSVNRGPLCDQVARARTTRSATCNDSVDM